MHGLSNILKLQATFLYSIYHQRAGKTNLFHMRGGRFHDGNTLCTFKYDRVLRISVNIATKAFCPMCFLFVYSESCFYTFGRIDWVGWFWFYWGVTPQQQPGSYQGGEMMMKSVFWWRKPEYPEETTDLRRRLARGEDGRGWPTRGPQEIPHFSYVINA